MAHPPTGPAWLIWLETSGAAGAMREWTWLYPIVEILHIAGFVILVGAAVYFDLRLLGLSRQLPVEGLEHHLLRWARGALLVVAPTGFLMFAAHATEFAGNPAFRLKLVLLLAAGLNALAFHRGVFRRVAGWNVAVRAPAVARLAAVLSLALWAGVICCGRLIAYF